MTQINHKIRIVNWLLTRRCNLKCEYCAIVRNYKNMPKEYPDMSHYISNQMAPDRVINGLEKIKKHNPDCFHIFYGGEPFLFKGLSEVINYCNYQDIHYTIITNNTDEIQGLIEKLLGDVIKGIKGLTSSVDPIFHQKDASDRVRKSVSGFERLVRYKAWINDIVAEITVMNENVPYIYDLVKQLSENGINSDITFIDIAKNQYYDFANVWEPWKLVHISPDLAKQFQMLHDDKELDIHMKDFLLPEIWNILPSNMDCKLQNGIHNLSVDADGSIRLCLRVRGVGTPTGYNLENIFDKDGNFNQRAYISLCFDKQKFCQLCNHTCQLMSMFGDQVENLVHLNKRGGK